MQGYGGGSSNVYGGRSPGPAKAKPAFLRSYGGKFAKPVQKGVLPGSVADGSEASRRRRRERTTGTEVGRDHWRATKKEQSSREQRVAARARLRAPHGGRGSSDRRSGSSRQGGSRRSGSRSGSQDGCSRGGGSPDGRLPALRSRLRSQQGGRGGQDPREISPRHRVDRHPGNRDRGGGGGGSRGSGARSVPLLHMPEFSDAAPAAPAEEHVALMGGQAYFNGFDAEQCDVQVHHDYIRIPPAHMYIPAVHPAVTSVRVQLRGGSLALSAWVFPTEQGTSAGTRDVFYKKEKGRPGGLPRLAGGMAVDKWQVLVQKGQDVGDELLRHVGILPSGGSGGRVSACTPTVLRNPRTHVLRVCFSTKKSGFAIVDSPLELRAGTWSHFLVAVSGPRLVVQVMMLLVLVVVLVLVVLVVVLVVVLAVLVLVVLVVVVAVILLVLVLMLMLMLMLLVLLVLTLPPQVNGETAVNVDMGDDDAAVVNEVKMMLVLLLLLLVLLLLLLVLTCSLLIRAHRSPGPSARAAPSWAVISARRSAAASWAIWTACAPGRSSAQAACKTSTCSRCPSRRRTPGCWMSGARLRGSTTRRCWWRRRRCSSGGWSTAST